MLTTIQSADLYFDTACKPILVLCDDLQLYVAKYASAGDTIANRLFREYIGTNYINQFGLATQPTAFIRLRREDYGVANSFSRRPTITIPMLGSLYDSQLKEVDRFLQQFPQSQKGDYAGEDYLTICFADIWIGNDDRNYNNHNLLLKTNDKMRQFVPIDHEAIFNGGNLQHGLYTLDGGSSLLSSPLLHRLFSSRQLSDKTRLQNLFDQWYLCVHACKAATPGLLDSLPPEWRIDKVQIMEQLTSHLFAEEWFSNCKQAFLQILQHALNIRSNGN